MGTNRAAVIFHPETHIYIRAMFQFITLQFLFIIVHVVSRGLMLITVRGVANKQCVCRRAMLAWQSVHTEIFQQLLDGVL